MIVYVLDNLYIIIIAYHIERLLFCGYASYLIGHIDYYERSMHVHIGEAISCAFVIAIIGAIGELSEENYENITDDMFPQIIQITI